MNNPIELLATNKDNTHNNILIIGGCGSIGFPIAKHLAKTNDVSIIDSHEWSIYLTRRDYKDTFKEIILHDAKYPIKGDYSLIINCAAYKHIGLCEEYPEMSYLNNVEVVRNIIRTDIPFIQISTDKAVNPISSYGKHKREAELITMSTGNKVLRLPNVIGTRGSIFETLDYCMKNNKPFHIHHPQLHRYFITKKQVMDAIDFTIENSYSMVIPVNVMGDYIYSVVSIYTRYHNIQITYGDTLPPYEKLQEELYYPEECLYPPETGVDYVTTKQTIR